MKRRCGISSSSGKKEKPNHLEETYSSYVKRREKYINPSHVMAEMLVNLFRSLKS